MAGTGGNLWKPKSGSNRAGAVFLSTKNQGAYISIVDSNGRTVGTGKFRGYYSDGRAIYDFPANGSSYGSDVFIVTESGQAFYIANAAGRADGLTSTGTAKRTTDGYDLSGVSRTQTGTVSLENSESNVPGIPGLGNIADVALIDPELNKQVSITDTELEFTDPVETLRQIAKENRGQMDENFITALEQAGKLSESETQQLKDYLNQMSPVEQELIAGENKFNQQQKLQAAETAMPGIQSILNGEIKNAQTLANGKMLTSSEDLALEQTARSAGADAAWTRGLGDDSLVGRTLSNQLSVSQRQAIMAQGQNYLNTATTLAATVLMDSPNKAKLSQGIPSLPQTSLSALTNQQQARLDAATTMSPSEAQNSLVTQRSTQAQLDYDTKVKNADLEENYITRAIEIDSANKSAINQRNQNYLTDQTETTNAIAKSKQRDMLEWLIRNGYIDDKDEQERLMELIESGGSINMNDFGDDILDRYRRDRGLVNSESKDPDSVDRGTGGGTGGVTGGGTTEDTDSTKSSDLVLYNKTTSSVTGGNYTKGKIYQSDGTVTIPTYNIEGKNTAYMTNLELADFLTSNGGIL